MGATFDKKIDSNAKSWNKKNAVENKSSITYIEKHSPIDCAIIIDKYILLNCPKNCSDIVPEIVNRNCFRNHS